MPRFEKTSIHWASAGLFLLGLYALAGLVYSWVVGSGESVTVWVVVAALAFCAAFVSDRWIRRRRRRTGDATG